MQNGTQKEQFLFLPLLDGAKESKGGGVTTSGRFDPETHRYWIVTNGVERPVPGVTQVLSDLVPGWKASEFYLGKGRAVHAAAAFVARGITFEHDPRIAGQVEAARKFFREIKPAVVAVERQVYSPRYLYGGTLDLDCEIGGIPVIGDYKAALTPATIYQCAAYAQALREAGRKIDHGVGIELREDGNYRMSELWPLKRATQEWLALLTAYRVREKIGCLNKEEDV